MFLPAILVSILLLIGGALIMRPEEPIDVQRAAFDLLYAQLPPISSHEKTTGVVLSICFLLFATSSLHSIPDAVTCLFGIFVLCASHVIQASEISSGISWDIILFVGATMSFGAIFSASGLSEWFAVLLFPLFGSLMLSPWIFMPVMLILLFAWRFIDVALLTLTIAVLSSVLPRLQEIYGLNPLAWLPLFCFAICAFFLK